MENETVKDIANISEKLSYLAKQIALITFSLFSLVALGVFKAFILLTLYNWFLAPLGLPSLNLFIIMGIQLISRLFMTPKKEDKIDSFEKLFKYVLKRIIFLGMALGFGYLITLCM